MREVNDGVVRAFSDISALYPNDFAVVEIVNIDYSIGEELGKILVLCDSFDEAWETKRLYDSQTTIVLDGDNRMCAALGCFT